MNQQEFNERRRRGVLDFTDATLEDVHIEQQDLDGSCWDGAGLFNVSFSGGSLYRATFRKARLHECLLENLRASSVNFSEVKVENCRFQNCNMAKMHAPHSTWVNARLVNVDLLRAYLLHTLWKNCSLDGVHFSHARLDNSLLSCLQVRDLDLTQAALSETWVDNVSGLRALQVHDERGYRPFVIWGPSGWEVIVGCRRLPLKAAKKHWGRESYDSRERGDNYVNAIEQFERNQPAPPIFD